jgi:hypothetical protein
LPARQHHLVRAFLIEFAQPYASFVRIHRFQPLIGPMNVPYLF